MPISEWEKFAEEHIARGYWRRTLADLNQPFGPGWGAVYKLVRRGTSRCYVGQTCRKSVAHRMCQHRGAHRRGGGCRRLNNSIRKHGFDAFDVFVLGHARKGKDLDAFEAAMIKEHNALCPKGYNILEHATQNPMSNKFVRAKRAQTMLSEAPRKRISIGVATARAERSEEAQKQWVENVRAAQTTPEMLLQRSQSQSKARSKKTPEELAEWNRRAADGMKERARVYVEEKLATMTPEAGKKWLARLEATRKWRANCKKVRGPKGWKHERTSSRSRPSAAEEEGA